VRDNFRPTITNRLEYTAHFFEVLVPEKMKMMW
jgi:hypothetical protein